MKMLSKTLLLLLSIAAVGCARVEFNDAKLIGLAALSSTDSDPVFPSTELFEFSVGGIQQASDQFGEVLLSGSVTALPAMEISMDNVNQTTLTTGFVAVVSEIE